MNQNQLATIESAGEIAESLIIKGDLSRLTPAERAEYYTGVCRSLGLNPLTQPFAYITLSGKLTLYAKKDATDQLRRIYRVSITKIEQTNLDGVHIVTAYAELPDGRRDSDSGAVNIANLKGDALANAVMKAITKAKRRVTLSICGLGVLDETELETIPDARPFVEVTAPQLPAPETPPPPPSAAIPGGIENKDDFMHAAWQEFGYDRETVKAVIFNATGQRVFNMSRLAELWGTLKAAHASGVRSAAAEGAAA